MPNLANPETSFFWIDDNREGLVVGTQDELREELNLMAVLLLGFNLVVESRAEVLQPLGVLAFVQHHLIHYNEKFCGPVLIELAAEVFVGVERDIILENGFQEIEECGFTCVTFLRDKQQNGKLLEWASIEQLDVVHPQFVLLFKDMMHE